jgi:hypothetical protein
MNIEFNVINSSPQPMCLGPDVIPAKAGIQSFEVLLDPGFFILRSPAKAGRRTGAGVT